DVRLQLPHPPHGVLDLGDDLGLAVELLDAEAFTELVDQGKKRDGLPEGDALSFEPRHRFPRLGEPAAEFEEQARFADPGVAGDEHDLPPARLGLGEALDERGDLAYPTHEGREPPLDGGVEARATDPRAKDFPGTDRRMPLDLHLTQVQRLEERGSQPVGRLAHHHAPGPRELLHSGGEVGGVADRRVIHTQVVADAPHHHGARVDPDPHLKRRPTLGGELLAVVPERALDAHGGGRPMAGCRARRGASWWAMGAPNSAITPSPVYWLTVPSNRGTSAVISSKHRSMIRWTSSGSSFSAMGVKPATSVKSTVTCRR